MGAAERRNDIMRILCRRRHETISNLAFELGASYRTIRRDIEELSLTEPIYTQCGRYDGGVYVMDGYSMGDMYLSENESSVLHKILEMAKHHKRCILTEQEISVFKNIIIDYSKPLEKKEKMHEK